MKRISKFIIAFILFFTFSLTTEAKDCVIISGTGKNLGDEVACGTEHFYVIENDGTNTKLLAKYNLLAGYGYAYIDLDGYKTDNYYDIYLIDSVKKLLEEGLYIEDVDYEEDTETGEITFYSVMFIDEYDCDDKIIWFDEPIKEREDIFKNSKVKEYINKGYSIYEEIETEKGYIGITIYKYDYSDSKYIFFDDQRERDIIDIYKIPEVKELIDDGYSIIPKYYNNKKCSTTGCKYDFYAIEFYKSEKYQIISHIFDSPLTQEEYNNYINTNPDIQEKLTENYNATPISESYNDGTTTTYFYYGVELEKEQEVNSIKELLQNPKAIGINGSVESPNYPFHGIIDTNQELIQIVYEEDFYNGAPYGDGNFQDIDFEALSYFENYKETLKKMGYTIKTIDMLKVSELSDIIEEITGEPIPLEDWYNNKTYIDGTESYKLGNLKELIADKHPWLYSTTYWLGTLDPDYYTSLYDINTMGDLCSTSICRNDPTTGIRPLITMASENIKYEITTKVNGEGTLTASHETADPDHEISFEVKPAEGYVLGEIKVTDEDGNVITFTDYKFTMPSANVIIEATFVPYNPDTADRNIIIISILVMIGAYLIIKNNKKLSWLK